MTPKILDCGHVDDWGDGFGARDATDRSLCRECAYRSELAHLKDSVAFFAYLSDDSVSITIWSGQSIASRKGSIRTSRGRNGLLWTFRAVDVHGNTWACRHWPNAGQYVRMYRVKEREK